MCKGRWNKWVSIMMLCMGCVSFLFGLLMFLIVKPEGHAANTLMGMFTGFGAGILGVAVTRLIRQKVVSKEKLEQEQQAQLEKEQQAQLEKEMQDLTDKFCKEIDAETARKEKELMEI